MNSFIETAQISTGNPATVNDKFDSTQFNNNAQTTPGASFITNDSSGRFYKWRYVRLNSTTFPTLVVGPVYWKDNTRTVVTTLLSEAIAGANSVAGFLLNTSATNGNWVCILVNGWIHNAPVPASTAAGDVLVGATGQQTLARVASGTAPTNFNVALALAAVAGGTADVFVDVEDYN